MLKHKKKFELLEKIANEVVPVGNARLAACVVYKNNIISIGINKRKSHPFQRKHSRHPCSIFLHAEISAIKNSFKNSSLKQLSKSTLYILRIKKNGKWALAKPCIGCDSAIKEFGIKKVLYTTNDEWFKQETIQ